MPRSVLLVAVASLTLLGACGSAPYQTGGRLHRGTVYVFTGAGQRQELVHDAGYPQLTLTTQFHLRLAGTAGSTRYGIQATIDPVNVAQRYEFPKSSEQLTVTLQRDGKSVTVTTVSGFLMVEARDQGSELGSAYCSLDLSAGGGSLAEVDLKFDAEAR